MQREITWSQGGIFKTLALFSGGLKCYQGTQWKVYYITEQFAQKVFAKGHYLDHAELNCVQQVHSALKHALHVCKSELFHQTNMAV